MNQFSTTNNILYSPQFVFRAKRSPEDAVNKAIEGIQVKLEKDMVVAAISFDIKITFGKACWNVVAEGFSSYHILTTCFGR